MKKYWLEILIPIFLLASCKDNNESKSNSNNDSAVTSKLSLDKNEIHKNVYIMAKPDSIAINASNTAVIVVDMENAFAAKGGMLDRAGINISMIQKVISPTAKVLAAARQAGIKIIYLKMAYHDDLTDLGSEESPNRMRHLYILHVGDTIKAPDGSTSRILIRGSWSTDIVPELKPEPEDIIMYKTRFSGFYKTELDSTLKKLDKKNLIFVGCTTSVCVESTIRDAFFRDYSAVLLEDCTAEPMGYDFPRSNYEASLLTIQSFGWVSSSVEFIKAINKQPVNKEQKLQ